MKPAADHPLQLALGLSVWSVWFVVVYAGVSIPCAGGASVPSADAMAGLGGVLGDVRGGLLLVTVATATLLVMAAGACARQARRLGTGAAAGAPADVAATADPAVRRFVATVAAALHLTAAIATVFVGLPMLVMPPCV